MESFTGPPEFDLQHTRAVGTISHFAGNKQCNDIQDQTALIWMRNQRLVGSGLYYLHSCRAHFHFFIQSIYIKTEITYIYKSYVILV